MATIEIPEYAPGNMIRRTLAGVSARRLRAWAERGYIRCAKLGDSRQAPALYNVEDVREVLDALAHGRRPRRKVR